MCSRKLYTLIYEIYIHIYIHTYTYVCGYICAYTIAKCMSYIRTQYLSTRMHTIRTYYTHAPSHIQQSEGHDKATASMQDTRKKLYAIRMKLGFEDAGPQDDQVEARVCMYIYACMYV